MGRLPLLVGLKNGKSRRQAKGPNPHLSHNEERLLPPRIWKDRGLRRRRCDALTSDMLLIPFYSMHTYLFAFWRYVSSFASIISL